MQRTLNANLFPIAFTLPDGKVFIAANTQAIIYDWHDGSEEVLPDIPNGVRISYPMSGTGLLLPLSPQNDYVPEILICGGSTLDDQTAGYDVSSQTPASSQCSRLVLNDAGIRKGWVVEHMPQARVMPDAVLLPNGKVVIVNGAQSGIAGYGNVKDPIGQSNAANPALRPVLYDPSAPLGKRFSTEGMPTSDIPRMYHSVASLTPNGTIMIAGSNPNLDRSNTEYGTEYRMEWLNPPYTQSDRPLIRSLPKVILYGKTFEIDVTVDLQSSKVQGN